MGLIRNNVENLIYVCRKRWRMSPKKITKGINSLSGRAIDIKVGKD